MPGSWNRKSPVPEQQDLSRFRLPPNFRGRSAPVVFLWQIVQGSLFAWSPQFAHGWRRFLLKAFGARIGRRVIVRPSARITYPWKIEIGDYSWIGDHAELYSLGSIRIGAHCVISQRAYLCAGTHDYRSPDFAILSPPIQVGDQVWIATDVFVAPGITIGDGAVIGARSSVFHDIGAGEIAFGSPAKVQGKR
jgi:putative colanic acid biosynthesis acetyltransferase WcaF